jgi:hypothetical protein
VSLPVVEIRARVPAVERMAGHAFEASRRVAAREAAVFPGRYSLDGQVVMLGVTWRR